MSPANTAPDPPARALAAVRRDRALAERYKKYVEITGFDRGRVPGLIGLAVDDGGNTLIVEGEGARARQGMWDHHAWLGYLSRELAESGFPAATLLEEAAEDDGRRLEGIVVRLAANENVSVVRAPAGIDDVNPATGIIDYKAGLRRARLARSSEAPSPQEQGVELPHVLPAASMHGVASVQTPLAAGADAIVETAPQLRHGQMARAEERTEPEAQPRTRGGPDVRRFGGRKTPQTTTAVLEPDGEDDDLKQLKARNRREWSQLDPAAPSGSRGGSDT